MVLAAKNNQHEIVKLILSQKKGKIDFNIFNNCSKLREITIPPTVTIIKEASFSKCSSLKKITFESPSSLTLIENGAFCDCSSLIEISIPPSVTYIQGGIFYNCTFFRKSNNSFFRDFYCRKCFLWMEIAEANNHSSICKVIWE